MHTHHMLPFFLSDEASTEDRLSGAAAEKDDKKEAGEGIGPAPPTYRRKRPKKPRHRRRGQREMRFYGHASGPSSVFDKPPMRRRTGGKRPWATEELSPMSLYSRPPPYAEQDNETGMGRGNNGGPTDSDSGRGGADGGGGAPASGGGSDAAGGNNGTSANNNNNNNVVKRNGGGGGDDQQQQPMDFENFEYPDSPTQKWLADNADLSPLTVLDNINLKTEFPYAAASSDIEKPPDNNNCSLAAPIPVTVSAAPPTISVPTTTVAPEVVSSVDSGVVSAVATAMDTTSVTTENLLHFAASVPVPDSSATFLDIGSDSFSQSLYDDLGDINLGDFQTVGANNNHVHVTTSTVSNHTVGHTAANTIELQPVLATPTATATGMDCVSSGAAPTAVPAMTTTTVVLQPKPVTLEKIVQPVVHHQQQQQHHIQELQPQQQQQQHPVNIGDLMRIKTEVVNPIKNLIEPLPASALRGLIKVEQAIAPPLPPPPPVYPAPNLVKLEQQEAHLPQQPVLPTTPLPPPPPPPPSATPQTLLKLDTAMPTPMAVSSQPPPGEVFSPLDSMGSSGASLASPGSPGGSSVHPHSPVGSGVSPTANSSSAKGKGSPARKKSTSSSEEDDIANIPSLKMRIQVISQRVSNFFTLVLNAIC